MHCCTNGALFLLVLQEVAREWTNAPYNFDNLGMALVSLFVTATLNGYTGERCCNRNTPATSQCQCAVHHRHDKGGKEVHTEDDSPAQPIP